MMDAELEKLRKEASAEGLFLPLSEDLSVLDTPVVMHGLDLPNRTVLQMHRVYDADANGAPTALTTARYVDAVKEHCYGMIWTEPLAISPDARAYKNQLVLSEANLAAFSALCDAIHTAAMETHGRAPVVIALLDHSGRRALIPVTTERSRELPTAAAQLPDEEITKIVVNCGVCARVAEEAGFSGAALNAVGRNLFAESLAAFHRKGRFGGDFDNRTRFLRDAFTSMKQMTRDTLLTLRLCLSDGLPKPNGWGMSFSAPSEPDISEPTMLLQVLKMLYGIELVACQIGIPNINWMGAAETEPEIVCVSRLCDCVAQLDSNLQQNVQLIMPQYPLQTIPFRNLAAGMIAGEFATFAGFAAGFWTGRK